MLGPARGTDHDQGDGGCMAEGQGADDADGETQTSDRVMPIPDGATGWQKIVVTVT